MKEKNLFITPISNHELIEKTKTLPKQGALKISDERLVYLDIDDNYIHQLFPLIGYIGVRKPDYFSMGIGAHISVIYPNEHEAHIHETDSFYQFEVINLFKAQTEDAMYFALKVKSPELLKLRSQYQLAPQLNLNGYSVDLHITIGKIETS
jgi:hypothetical protein